MKTIHYIKQTLLLALAVIGLAACNEDGIDDLTGKYSIQEIKATASTGVSADKLGRGVKALNVTLTDDDGCSVALRMGSLDWTPAAGTYTVASEVAASGEYSATATWGGTARTVASGQLTVAQSGDGYDISGVMQTTDGSFARLSYNGPIAFVAGEDDPEASGYTMTVKTEQVSVTDWTTYQTTVYPELTKYVLTFSDPNGAAAAEFHLISGNNKQARELAGTYTLQSNPAAEGLADAGWTVPAYYMAGGSYYVDATGTTQYTTAGQITLSTAEDANGNTLFSISGSGLSTTTADATQTSTTGAVDIRYASYNETKGTVLRDLTIESAVLGRTMKYSVYLPDGYDGQTTLPVLYMLHGYGGNNNSWLDDGTLATFTSSAISDGTLGRTVVVMPDGLNAFYCNGYGEEQLNYEDYLFNELIPTVEATLNVGKERSARAIGGLSMGGYGTLLHAIKHADMFCCAYAMSPAVYVDGAPNLWDLVYTVQPSTLPDLTIEVGTEDQMVYAMVPYFHQTLQSLGLPAYNYIERTGVHDWTFWRECYPKFMTKLGQYFTSSK